MTTRPVVRDPLVWFMAALLLLACTPWAAGQETDQLPTVPREFLERVRQLNGDVIRFCVYDGGLTEPVDRSVTAAIGELLLVEAEVVDVTAAISIEAIDFVPISEDQLFIHMNNDCDAFMGFTLAAGIYPSWLTVTRPYLETSYVALARHDGPESLRELGQDDVVATTIMSEGDVALLSYADSLPENRQWSRHPYPHVRLALERLLDGTADVAVLWEPAFHFMRDRVDGMDDLVRISSDPVALPTREVGIALRSNSTYLRTLLDDAISALTGEGLLDAILAETDFPGAAPDVR